MKNIIFITNYFGHGGAATVMKTIIERLPEDKYNIKLISFLDDDKKYKIPENVEYINVDIHKKETRIEKIKKILNVRKIIKQNKETIVVSFEFFINMRTILACLFLKNSIIISERNDPSKSGYKRKKLRNFLYRFCDILVCQTNDAKDYFPDYIRKKTVVIPNPVKDNLPKRFEGERIKKIVTFCRVEKQKNLPMMLDAFKEVQIKFPDYCLEIYGDGKEKENIVMYAKKINLEKSVKFYDFIPDIHSKIINYAMFISTSDFEGISNSMLEAMAIGLPTICTDCPCGGAKMVIHDKENGILSPVNDSHTFAKKMIDTLENKELLKKISENASKVRDEFSSEKICRKWEDLIK